MSSTGQGGTPGAAVGEPPRPGMSPAASAGTTPRTAAPGAPSPAAPSPAAQSTSAPTAPTPTARPNGSSTGASSTTQTTPTTQTAPVGPNRDPQSRSEANRRTAQRQGAPRQAGRGGPPPRTGQRRATTRRVKLAVARVDPWSVMKLAFLLAVAAGIAGVVLTGVLWLILSGMGVFSDIDRVVREIQPSTTTPFNLMNYIGFGRVISLAIVLGVIDIILMTAIATLGAFLYNICSSLVGGIQLTLTDD